MEGHAVKIVHSGEEAIAISEKHDFNLSFMDVILPGMNGVESFIQIKRLRPLSRVYMMTGYSVEELLTQALHGGALGVLEKPFDPEAILNLTTSMGPAGLVLAPPRGLMQHGDVGHFINQTLSNNGMRCRHVMQANGLNSKLEADEILLLDLPAPLIEGMEVFKRAQETGHRGHTFIVPHARTLVAATETPFRDISLTGILNKPFDPLELINKLPQLAA